MVEQLREALEMDRCTCKGRECERRFYVGVTVPRDSEGHTANLIALSGMDGITEQSFCVIDTDEALRLIGKLADAVRDMNR